MGWSDTEDKCSSEGGKVVLDQEHDLGARITLERECRCAPFAITCGIYGWMVHTRFLSSEAEARTDYVHMQDALAEILKTIPLVDDPDGDQKMSHVFLKIQEFTGAFPLSK